MDIGTMQSNLEEYIHLSIEIYRLIYIYIYIYIYNNNNNNNQNVGMTMVNEEALCLSSRLPISLSYRTIMRRKL